MDASGGLAPTSAVSSAVVGLPAAEIAARVRAGELSAVDARVGAFRVVRRSSALIEAAAVDAAPERGSLPLAGVPIAVKDNVAVTGEICTDGSPAVPQVPQTADHPVVARLRAAGAVVIGITRAPELCLYASTDGPGAVSRKDRKSVV